MGLFQKKSERLSPHGGESIQDTEKRVLGHFKNAKGNNQVSTMNISNTEVDEILCAIRDGATGRIQELIRSINLCNILAPYDKNEKGNPVVRSVEEPDGRYLLVYTGKEHIPEDDRKNGFVNIKYYMLNKMAQESDEGIKGILLNPDSHHVKVPLHKVATENSKKRK